MKSSNKLTLLKPLFAGVGLLAFITGALAQHYPAGAEGLRAASLPPPGIYLRDYNIFYAADKIDGGPPGNTEVFAYVHAPRVIWMTGAKILGANYGMDVILPFGYQKVKLDGVGVNDDVFGLGDIQIEPLLLSWHKSQWDIAAGYAIWAPTGDFDASQNANLGLGCWSHMLTAGFTYYIDPEKTWAISILDRYEFNHEQRDTDNTPGATFTSELAVGKTIIKGLEVGVTGYWQQQMTKSTGDESLDHVLAIGPEISAAWPEQGFFASFRYLHEFEAKNLPEGEKFVVTLTKMF